MWKYKDIAIFIWIYTFIVVLFSLMVNSKDITITTLYYNIWLFLVILIIYFITIDKTMNDLNFLVVHKFDKISNYYLFTIKKFSILNILLSFSIYIINITVTLLWGQIKFDSNYHFMYPIHLFIIFEIIYIIVLSFFKSSFYYSWFLIIFGITVFMYSITLFYEGKNIIAFNIFTYFFNLDTLHIHTMFHYIGYAIIIILLLNKKRIEI